MDGIYALSSPAFHKPLENKDAHQALCQALDVLFHGSTKIVSTTEVKAASSPTLPHVHGPGHWLICVQNPGPISVKTCLWDEQDHLTVRHDPPANQVLAWESVPWMHVAISNDTSLTLCTVEADTTACRVPQALSASFLDDSYVLIPNFVPDLCSVSELGDDVLQSAWRTVGPMDYRHYRLLHSYHGRVAELARCLGSASMRAYLQSLSGLELSQHPVVPLRVCHFVPGSYLIMNDEYAEPAGLDAVFCVNLGGSREAGRMCYHGSSELLLDFGAVHNQLAVVYRLEECSRFVRYVSRLCRDASIVYFTLTYGVD